MSEPCPYCRGYPQWIARKLGSICPCQVKCSKCIWGERLDARPDEPSKLGCTRPGWEGYTSDEKPSCGGTFFIEGLDQGKSFL